jgi:hypothetical protein
LTRHANGTVRTTVVRVCLAAVAACLARSLAPRMAGPSGGLLWMKAPKANYYSMIHRVRPDGTPRRVFLGVKPGRSAPRVDGTSGLALDSKGTMYFGAGVADPGNGYQVMRLDETRGTPVLVAGAPTPTDVNLGDGPARQAYFGRFKSICFSPDDTLYVNESNLVIRKLTIAGHVTTWAF